MQCYSVWKGKGTSCCQIKKGFMREILLMSWFFHGVHAQRAGGAGAGRRLLAWTCASRMPAARLCSSSEQKLDCEKVPSVFRQQAIPWPKTGAQGTNGGQGWGCRKATCRIQGKPPIPHPGGAQRYLSRQVVWGKLCFRKMALVTQNFSLYTLYLKFTDNQFTKTTPHFGKTHS